MPNEVDDAQADLAHLQHAALLEHHVGRHGDARGIDWVRHRGGTGGRHDLREGIPVVLVLVGGDDRPKGLARERDQAGRFCSGVDEGLLAGLATAQQVGIVVIGANSQFAHDESGELMHVGRPTDLHASVIHSGSCRPSGHYRRCEEMW